MRYVVRIRYESPDGEELEKILPPSELKSVSERYWYAAWDIFEGRRAGRNGIMILSAEFFEADTLSRADAVALVREGRASLIRSTTKPYSDEVEALIDDLFKDLPEA